jgi:hypothetical protein
MPHHATVLHTVGQYDAVFRAASVHRGRKGGTDKQWSDHTPLNRPLFGVFFLGVEDFHYLLNYLS